MKGLFFSMLALLSMALVPTSSYAQDMSDKTVVEIAAGNENFSTLVTAVKAAGLAGTLSGEGPFTVFAPTDEAFAALPDGLVAALVKPENKAVLQKILTYHVVPAKVMASDVVAGIEKGNGSLTATTAEGGDFTAMLAGGGVQIKDAQGNKAKVTATDIAGSNGVIHVIDRVILPAGVNPAALLPKKAMMRKKEMKAGMMMGAPEPNIASIAVGNENFETLVAALGAAGYVDMFKSAGEYTVFAPTDDAFDALPEGTVANLVKPEQKSALQGILAYHVVPAKITAEKLVGAITKAGGYYTLPTLGNQTLVASIDNGSVILTDGNGNRSKVVMTDVEASNGVIHAIDTVLLPK
ncbi:fasciclin domain-containing protein [Lewinella sp. W8]|uniref:fasciclin domain-containing protein n=1 Tax=Lewinella sp. W8 TaxID=2528208 RepID=UPI0011A763FB|nr:fasciclin domain-containing protein [Lewinella sp. W8]MTB53283.1 fasciclin domain-containing protein [Lewinella sp. W8]